MSAPATSIAAKLGRRMARLTPAGPKAYFPNFIFTLLRSGKARDANQAVFRVPPIMNRFDIKQYLEKIYGITVRSIATHNFAGTISRQGRRRVPAIKTAVVTMREAFAFPAPPPPEKLKHPLPDQQPNYHRIK